MKSLGSLLVATALGVAFHAASTHGKGLPSDDLAVSDPMEVVLKSFSNCEKFPSMPLMFRELQVTQVAKKKFAVNGGIDLNMTITDDIVAVVTILQCEDSTSDDNCEYVASMKGSKFCEKITKEGTPWYNFVKETEIGNHCPVNPGSYDFKEAPLEFKDAEGVPLTPGHWKIRMELYSADFEGDPVTAGTEPIGCNMVEVSVSLARSLRK